jgi:hypothetical protein
LEDLIGIIIFILFVVARANADRKRGMEKQPSHSSTDQQRPYLDFPFTQEEEEEPEYWESYDTVEGYDTLGNYGALESNENVAEQETMETYETTETYESMEGRSLEEQPTPHLVTEEEPVVVSPLIKQFGFAGMNMQQAVIWSEILQKPRALRKRIR